MPKERQLRVRHVYKSLSLGIEFIKSDVNLKLRLNVYLVTLSKADVVKGSTNINDPGVCATLAPKRLLDHLIQFAEKSRSGKYHFNVIIER